MEKRLTIRQNASMGDIVNLRRVRKQKARDEADRHAAENRARFGRSKAERQAEASRRRVEAGTLDGAHLEGGDAQDETA